MKKFFIMLLAASVLAVVNPTISDAKVMYDGAEVVKEQTGKMTFKKDIKVYKRNPNGTFDSLVVKRNNFFKTYDIEKYDGKTFYQMGQYRVQATDLVVFKEVPIKIRASFYQNPTYLYINRDRNIDFMRYGIYFNKDEKLNDEAVKISFLNNGQVLSYCFADADVREMCVEYPGTDIKIAETIKRKEGVRYELTEDTRAQLSPLEGYVRADDNRMYLKGSVFSSLGTEINGYLYVKNESDSKVSWFPVELLKPIGNK
ncbi:hypothetical protein [Lysinibacillus sp. G4S2]|uniref:hypothetical protein n=1 Tax=Lysinibacillus sp. G4S2 TaxID=3055859 RepID=UPI0025A11D00|nr:hypothetical protein [Lysinibacillus sp. G4S2]MDM5249624.1 hypothetical protein [Lysinibacillus sp. G4S2]